MKEPEVKTSPSDFIDKKSNREDSFWRLKKAVDFRRHKRIQSILAQESEDLMTTIGRVIYICVCILFDGLILIEIPIILGRSVPSWVLYGTILGFSINLQKQYYDEWFRVDLTDYDMN
jgi:hypothetical protein